MSIKCRPVIPSPTLISGLPIAAIAKRNLAGVIFGLRPPLRPRARAEASPARVRSEMRSRSNSASETKMPKTSLPAGVVVSIAPDQLGPSDRHLGSQGHARRLRGGEDFDQDDQASRR